MSHVDRAFHPEFATPYKDAVHPTLVMSNDDVYFYYDLSILVANSEFFDGMHSVPSKNAASASEPDMSNVVYIPKGSAPAVAFVLHALTWERKPRVTDSAPRSKRKARTRTVRNAAPPPLATLPALLPTQPAAPQPTSPSSGDTAAEPVPDSQPHSRSPSPAKPNPIVYRDGRQPPPEIQRSSPNDSGIDILEEIIDTANCYQLHSIPAVLYESLVHYRWQPSIIFTTAVLLDRGNAQYWSQKLLAAGPQGLHPWAVRRLRSDAPKVDAALANLFRHWAEAFKVFRMRALGTLPVDNNPGFGSRCKLAPEQHVDLQSPGLREKLKELHCCPVFSEYQGDFKEFRKAMLQHIFIFAANNPGLMATPKGLERFCRQHAGCTICSDRIAASMRSVWLKTMRHEDWSLDTKGGVRGPWRPDKERKGKRGRRGQTQAPGAERAAGGRRKVA